MRSMIGVAALATMIFLSGCSTVVSGCDGFSYITVPPEYRDKIGRYLTEQIATHNRFGVSECGWKKPTAAN